MSEPMSDDPFIDQIMRSIVKQFFDNPEIVVMDGSAYVPPRSTPTQVVAARMLENKQGELLDKIMEQLDLDDLAGDIADRVFAILTKPNSTGWQGRDPNDAKRNEINTRVDNRLVELLAQDMFATMQQAKANVDE